MSPYRINKALAVFINTEDTLTDQSQANDTDINVIVQRYGITGTAPGAPTPPQYEDYSELPNNLKDMIEQVRDVRLLRQTLPPGLREIPVDKLLTLTPTDIENILAPPAPPPAPEGEIK